MRLYRKLFLAFLLLVPVEVFLYLYVDLNLYVELKDRSQLVDDFFRVITQFGLSEVWLIPSLLLFLFFTFVKKYSRLAHKMLFLFSSIVVSGLINLFFKILLGRNRPAMYEWKLEYGFDFFQFGSYHLSFPSGHTNTVFAVAMVFYFWFPKYRIVIFSIATLVGLSRVVIAKHYLSDVIAGAFVAIVIAFVWRSIYEKKGWQF